jgi:Cu2+-exporting ATPase
MKKFTVTGMSCAACSSRVEKAVAALDGVQKCSVNLLTNTLVVDGEATTDDIISAVEAAGYGVLIEKSKVYNTPSDSKKEETTLRYRLVFSLVVLLGLMYISMGHTMFGMPFIPVFSKSPLAMALLQMVLSALVMIANQKFFVNGFRAMVKLSPNMDTLVAMGSMSAFLYSVAMTFDMAVTGTSHLHGLYFESAAMIVTLITVGKMLEERAKGKTTSAVKGLMDLAPKKANVIRNGKEMIIDARDVKSGDVFVLYPGSSLPVDGVVIEGESTVDESALTGESIPVDKTIGDKVYAATINGAGFLKCKATSVGEDTALSQIIKAVNDATGTKAPIAKIADKVSGIFVPFVIVVALITFAVWMLLGKEFGFALGRAISVLVVSCPCALGLATPVAIMVGTGVGAKNGILYKTATSLEITGKAKIVALDKTGTITEGKPKVTDVYTASGVDERELLVIAASLEKNSEHPLARAIVEYSSEKNILPAGTSDFKVYTGGGVSATVNERFAVGGNYKFVSEKVNIERSFVEIAESFAEKGKTPLYFCFDNSVVGIIAVADVVKYDSCESIDILKKSGVKVVMITGDNEKTARAIADALSIDEIYSDVKPVEKESVILSLKNQGKVIMVGDGINDAPALTRADIGIAIGKGTDIAVDAADVVLVKNSLSDVERAIKLSKAVIRNIKQNLMWAFGYNIIGIPLAAGLFIAPFGLSLNPMFGAAAMSFSSVFVVTNALRLNYIKLNKREKEVKNMIKVIKIEGLMCPHCEARAKSVLEEIAGVVSAEASHEKGEAVVTLDRDVDDNVLKSVVEAQGYKVTGIE